jgi:uncharacterized protein (TIGR00299 family) protein
MSLCYFDCFAGAAGDMIVAALVDAGADPAALIEHVQRLDLGNFSARFEQESRRGIMARRFHVEASDEQPHRHLSDILDIIKRAELPPRAARRATQAFEHLGRAEAQVHGIPLEKVHFHEVGAVDSIVDIVAAAVALELLNIDEVFCSPIPVGSGTVECDHGTLPVPAPATALLLKDAATYAGPVPGEAVTPTAAALLTTLAETQGPAPKMTLSAVGYGAGSREGGDVPNVLRVLIGQGDDVGTVDGLVELAANIDDATGEILGATIEKLLTAGCLDAWAQPAVAKKSRPAWVLTALCNQADVAAMERLIFTETTTFGIRRRPCTRSKLARRFETVETPFGPVRMKLGTLGEQVITASPEFIDCRTAAEAHGVAVRIVMDAARKAWQG